MYLKMSVIKFLQMKYLPTSSKVCQECRVPNTHHTHVHTIIHYNETEWQEKQSANVNTDGSFRF